MSYQTDDGKHEGWDAAEFPGGRFSVGSSAAGVLVRYLGPDQLAAWGAGRYDPDGEPEAVDGRTAIGWRGVCTCGWRGPLWLRVTDPAAHDLAARRAFDVDPVLARLGDAPGPVEDAIHKEWLAHLPPPALDDVRAAAEDVRKAQAALDDAVARARDIACSWADIGDAAGITRQSAHERWGKR
jgi:hypothetical protein